LKKSDAEAAIDQMNGQWLGANKIKTSWALRNEHREETLNKDSIKSKIETEILSNNVFYFICKFLFKIKINFFLNVYLDKAVI
jgi:hypothetical protein